MRSAVQTVALSMTCTIERYTAAGEDAYGQPTGAWADLDTEVPCFYSEQSEREVQGPQISGVFAGSQIVLPAQTDVHAGDRIRDVVDGEGVTRAAALEITEVLERQTDVVAAVEEVS